MKNNRKCQNQLCLNSSINSQKYTAARTELKTAETVTINFVKSRINSQRYTATRRMLNQESGKKKLWHSFLLGLAAVLRMGVQAGTQFLVLEGEEQTLLAHYCFLSILPCMGDTQITDTMD